MSVHEFSLGPRFAKSSVIIRYFPKQGPVVAGARGVHCTDCTCVKSAPGHSAVPAFGQPLSTYSTVVPAQHLRPSGFLSRWPHDLELSPGFYPGPDDQCRLFQAFT